MVHNFIVLVFLIFKNVKKEIIAVKKFIQRFLISYGNAKKMF